MATNGNSHHPRWTGIALKLPLALLLIGALTAVGIALHANAAPVGFAYLIAILFVALWGGLTTSLVSSIVATASYNFFFLPPVRTFTIQDPANWVALASFFIASLVVSRLLVDARTQTAHAEEREREIEALYALSIDLFAATSRVGAVAEATARVLRSVEATGGGLLLFAGSPHAQQVVSWSGPKEEEIEDLVAGVGRHGLTLEFPGRNGRELYVALKIGGRIAGVLVARGTRATVRAVESVAALLALAVERERFVAEGVHLQALRESDALKTSILRAVSHDLNTPLVAIALQIERLRERIPPQSADRAVLETIATEADRLRRRQVDPGDRATFGTIEQRHLSMIRRCQRPGNLEAESATARIACLLGLSEEAARRLGCARDPRTFVDDLHSNFLRISRMLVRGQENVPAGRRDPVRVLDEIDEDLNGKNGIDEDVRTVGADHDIDRPSLGDQSEILPRSMEEIGGRRRLRSWHGRARLEPGHRQQI
ncbi:MAG TPA: DUF4118 domain-containing protein, partial [Thermoanaerobaculia bacterium]